MLKQWLATTHNFPINFWVSAKTLLMYRLFYYASLTFCYGEGDTVWKVCMLESVSTAWINFFSVNPPWGEWYWCFLESHNFSSVHWNAKKDDYVKSIADTFWEWDFEILRVLFFWVIWIRDSDSDHSNHDASNKAMNPQPEWIHRFLWLTKIWVILDHWYWSWSLQRNVFWTLQTLKSLLSP